MGFAQQKVQQYAIKSGYIEYALSGSTTGTKKIWWDNYGEKSRTETRSKTVTKLFGMKSEDQAHTVDILVKDKYWSANLLEQTGQNGSIPFYAESHQAFEGMTKKEQEEFADRAIESMGGQKMGSASVMGKSCDVVKIMGSKIWIYKGLTLKSETKIMGIVSNETAVKFQAGQAVAASQFAPLSNIAYKNIDRQQGMGDNAGGMQGLMQAMENDGMNDSDDDDDDTELIPVKYPYAKFQKQANAFSYEGYKKMMVTSMDGAHSAVFAKGPGEMLMVGAVSRKNGDISQAGNFETFVHKGRKYRYGKMDDDEEDDDNPMLLLIEIPQYDTYITIGAIPAQTKHELLEMADRFGF